MVCFRCASLVLGLLAGSLFLGCGAVQQARVAAQRQQMANNLKQLGVAYHNYLDVNNKAPAGWQDLQTFLGPEIQQQLEAAGYTFIWGLKPADAKQGTSNTIIAHHANAATEGGHVLLLDGSVQQLTGPEIAEKLAAQSAP
jgi:hypothetical protein